MREQQLYNWKRVKPQSSQDTVLMLEQKKTLSLTTTWQNIQCKKMIGMLKIKSQIKVMD